MGSISMFTTSSTSTTNLYSTSAPQTQTQPTQQDKTPSSDQQDTVKLSTAAQAKILYKEGSSVSVIAATLGTTKSAVNDLLGITLDKAMQAAIESTSKA